MPRRQTSPLGERAGRYLVYDEIARGGMASVHLGRLVHRGRLGGPSGFSRTVAIKRLHAHAVGDRELAAMLLDEARLAARICHANVVSTLDVVEEDAELLLVMEYVAGETLAMLMSASDDRAVPIAVAVRIFVDVLSGLHAAHEATDEKGRPLHIVHRDVSPQNVLVGADGVARVLDFGIAKAVARSQVTRDGQIKGKLAYMSPEQLRSAPIDRRSDVFSASVCLYEALTGRRLFTADNPAVIALNVIGAPILPPSRVEPTIPPALDAVVLRGLERNSTARYATAREMAQALEAAATVAGADRVSDWVRERAASSLDERARRIAEIEDEAAAPVSSPAAPARSDTSHTTLRRRAEAVTDAHGEANGFVTASDSAHHDRSPRRRSLGGALRRGLFGVAALAALAAFWSFGRDRSTRPAHSDVSSIAQAVARAADLPAADLPAPAPAVSAPIASASPAPRLPARAVATGSTKRADCDPPFSWDAARGIKVPKRHCFD